MRPWTGICVLLGLAVGGCRSQPAEFPLAVGKTWTYSVRTGLVTHVEPVKVTRSLSVAGVSGYELSGPMGVSRVGWKDQELVADALANASFNPALPLLISGEERARRSWSGTMTVAGSGAASSAILVQEPETRQVGGKSVRAIKAVLTLKARGRTVEVITWYVAGTGPVMQEQRTDGRLDISLEAV
jgi:hypothetical protein